MHIAQLYYFKNIRIGPYLYSFAGALYISLSSIIIVQLVGLVRRLLLLNKALISSLRKAL